jgi:hypothetical protein
VNPFEFVIAIVFLAFAFRIIAHRLGMRTGWDRRGDRFSSNTQDSGETLRLREEVQELKERLKVLERITVDKENSLAKEIESLRDH